MIMLIYTFLFMIAWFFRVCPNTPQEVNKKYQSNAGYKKRNY